MEALNRKDAEEQRKKWEASPECWLINRYIAELKRLLYVQNGVAKLTRTKPTKGKRLA